MAALCCMMSRSELPPKLSVDKALQDMQATLQRGWAGVNQTESQKAGKAALKVRKLHTHTHTHTRTHTHTHTHTQTHTNTQRRRGSA